MSPRLLVRRLSCLAVLATVGIAAGAIAQPAPAYPSDVVNQGAAYFVFTEPGAPTVEVVLVQTGSRAGIYRVAEGTTLTDFLALAGVAPPRSSVVRDGDRETIQTTTVRVLRDTGGTRTVIYEADPDRFLREPAQHPELLDGDVVQTEVDIQYRELPDRFTLAEGLDIAARVASFASLVILLVRSSN